MLERKEVNLVSTQISVSTMQVLNVDITHAIESLTPTDTNDTRTAQKHYS